MPSSLLPCFSMQYSLNKSIAVLTFPLHFLRRDVSSTANKRWGVKQVTRSNFGSVFELLKQQIHNADYISISLQSTGTHGAPWRRIFPFDTPETAYYKAKDSAERFQLLHFGVCPFKWADSKIIAFPYNFHLFPRDELRIGMPSYSFLCQSSSISSMVKEGFDFNSCIYDGISYLSKVQEASVKQQSGISRMRGTYAAFSNPKKSIPDMIFMERIKSQVQHWRNACFNSTNTSKGGLVYSTTRTILNNEMFGKRPCLRIDASSDHEVQLILEVLREFSENLVPLTNSVGVATENEVKVVFTISEEDKHLLQSELRQEAEDKGKRLLGVGDVVDVLINSGKTIVGNNCLTDFTTIYSNFIAPLPPTVEEFLSSVHGSFPRLVDARHLLNVLRAKEILSTQKGKSLQAVLSYLNRQFYLQMNLEVPLALKSYGDRRPKCHGYDLLRLTYLFSKVCRLLKISSSNFIVDACSGVVLASYATILYPNSICLKEPDYQGKVINQEKETLHSKTSNIVFIWGFKAGFSARDLLEMLHNMYEVCQKGINVQLVDESCACVRFRRSKYADIFVQNVESREGISRLANSMNKEEMASGLRAVSYNVYKKLCKLPPWKHKLADSFELAMSKSDGYDALNVLMDIQSCEKNPLILDLGDL